MNRRLPLRHGHRPRVALEACLDPRRHVGDKAGQRRGGLRVARVGHRRVDDDHRRIVAAPGQPVEDGVELGDVVAGRDPAVDPVPLPRLEAHAVADELRPSHALPAHRRVRSRAVPPAAMNHRLSAVATSWFVEVTSSDSWLCCR